MDLGSASALDPIPLFPYLCSDSCNMEREKER